MNDVLMQQFIELISANIGLYIREQDRDTLCKKVYLRMKLLNLSVPEQYYQLLKVSNESNSSQLNLSQREWRELTLLLTTGETFFFRDRGQISLLKNQILPELLEKKTQYIEGKAKPSLRIWTAGCSTGEETYSLAILVKQLISNLDKWNILILGTDINPESIEKAKRGIYDSWSFRAVNPDLQKRYFSQRNTSWEVDDKIRTMVTFRCGNLLKDFFPDPTSDIHNIDIILCRNVFIYFDSKTISIVLEKFYNTLRPQGYLIVGHTELHGQNLGHLQPKVFPESVVYQRSEDLQSPTLTTKEARTQTTWVKEKVNLVVKDDKPLYLSKQKKKQESASQISLSQAETLFHNGAYENAIKEAEQVIKQQSNHFGAYYLMAQAFANLGKSKQAIHCCQQALKLDSLSVEPYYILAHIAEAQGNIQQAKDLFKKIIYLAPSSIPAYLELGSLYEGEGDNTRSIKMRNTAFELLKKLPPSAPVEHQADMTASELLFEVKNLLKQ